MPVVHIPQKSEPCQNYTGITIVKLNLTKLFIYFYVIIITKYVIIVVNIVVGAGRAHI